MRENDQNSDVGQLLQLVRQLQAEVEQLREDNRQLREANKQLLEENQRLRNRLAVLEGKNPTPRVDQPYSVKAEEKRRQNKARQKKLKESSKQEAKQNTKPRGRRPTDEKVDRADVCEIMLPDGFDLSQCNFIRQRTVWRIRDGRSVRVVYEIWHGPANEKPQLPGVFPRSEFGMEIHVTVAFLVSIVGLSMDKVTGLLQYFWQLELSKSQADALLNQLAQRWQDEFETLCDLLAHSAVVHADETSWSVRSVWAFLSEQARVLVFGCRKDAATLAQVLSKESFAGILNSDDAAVYQGFSQAQKCWAHLLRKAIKLTLLSPENQVYRTFLDELLNVFYTAKRYAGDQRLSEQGRRKHVSELENTLADLLVRYSDVDALASEALASDEHQSSFRNLVDELIRLLSAEELFMFVQNPAAAATNNEAERSLRGAAMDRRTGRTSKTPKGARRRSILTSVFESLKLHLPAMNLQVIVAEVIDWYETGESLFDRLRNASGLGPPQPSRLNSLVPDFPKA